MAQFGTPEYLGYRLLHRLQESRGQVPKTVFHKFWSLADRHAREAFGVDLGVPRYWNKYGEMVDETQTTTDFFVSPSAPWGGQAYKPVYEVSESDFDLTDEERTAVTESVQWAIERLGGRDARQLEEYQYEHYAPNEFVLSYSNLRAYLQYTDLDTQVPLTVFGDTDPDDNREIVTDLLDKMRTTYPESSRRFDQLFEVYLRWDDTARLLVEQGNNFSRLEQLLDDFVQVLSNTVLRFEYNDDISAARLDEWDAGTDSEIENFETDLRRRRETLLSERERSGVLESVSDSYDETVLRDLTGKE
jgi:hypothetical protein